jgi:hypothetical protein
MRRRALPLAALALLCAAAPPPDVSHTEAQVDVQREAMERSRRDPEWFALPVLFWLPETRLGFGGAGGLHFAGTGERRSSNVFAVAIYTLNRQGSLDLSAELWTTAGSLLAVRTRGVVFPDRFYGIGPESSEADGEGFTRSYAELGAVGELAVLPGRLRMGPRIDLRTELVDDVESGGILDSGTVTGVGRFTAFGVGLSATWDTRDTPLWATRGTFAQGWFLGYPSTVGGGHELFARLGGEVRGFLPLPGRIVLGGAAYFEEAHGETPFALLPKLGSTRWLRGYREGRFRDRLAWAAQTEVRVPVRGRLAATGFVAAGDVAPSLGEIRWDTIKVAGGGGLRWRLSDGGAHVRADVAAAAEGVEVYVTLLEAF